MKKFVVIFLFAIQVCALRAQVNLEHTYNYSAAVVKFETLGYKYYLMDIPGAQCRIYNIDHSLYKTINCAVPSGCYLFDIKFLSENTFDTDSGIELLYTWYKYNTGSDYYDYDSKIISEDGSQIAFMEGALYNYINKTGDNSYKLFSYCFDFSSIPEVVWTNIYSLPGAPVISGVAIENSSGIELNAFPNPASNALKVAYILPDNIDSGILYLIDNLGRQVSQFVVDHYSDHLDLDISQLTSGVYYYFVEYGNTKTPAKKLVIQ